MLVLTRRVGQAIVISEDIQLTVVSMDKRRVRLGILAPASVAVNREEVLVKKRQLADAESASEAFANPFSIVDATREQPMSDTTFHVFPSAPTDRPGVLVVDDDPLIRQILLHVLRRSGFAVWLAASGPEAVEVYQRHQQAIDVALLDVCMPEMNGPATLRALRWINPEIKACFMSGDSGQQALENLLDQGVAVVIAKPFCLNQLSQVLHQVALQTRLVEPIVG